MNVVALVGNVASDPDIRTTAGGRSVCSFRVAVSRVGGQSADFFTVVTWERQAEACKQYVGVGRRVAVEGRLHQSQWKTEDGDYRSRIEVIASRIEFLGPSKRVERDEATAEAPGDGDADDTVETTETAENPFAVV